MKINWGIKIIIAFAVFAAGIITMAAISISNNTELVSENYYEQEIKYQDRINAMKNSFSLADEIVMNVNNENAILINSGNNLPNGIKGEIHFYRTSNARRDFTIDFKPGENGIQTVPSDDMEKGLWKVKFNLFDDKNKYFIEKNIIIN